MLVALEHLYELARSEQPLESARVLLANFAEDARYRGGSAIDPAQPLKRAIDILGAPALPSHGDEQDVTLIHVDELDPFFANERPLTEANVAAIDILKLAIRMRRERSWSRAERSKALIALCQKVATANENAPLDTPRGLEAIRQRSRRQRRVSKSTRWPMPPRPIPLA